MSSGKTLMSRRKLLGTAVLAAPAVLAASHRRSATADACIFIWLPGGMCQLDTLDPKRRGDGEKVPGSYYAPIKTAVQGIEVCEHLPLIAERMERLSVIRTLHHQFTDHTRAVDFVHTGRVASGTVVYPSVGSVIAHELGGVDPNAPPYLVIGEPMQPRGPGFLGGKANYLYITDTTAGPAGLQIPPGLTRADYERRRLLLAEFSEGYLELHKESAAVTEYQAVANRGFLMMEPKFQKAFTVAEDPADIREAYGEEFGQRLLLSRKAVEAGVRFVECSFNIKFINGYGWDTHAFAQKRQHLIIRQLDQGIKSLIDDLDKRKMLDRTLVVVATEFGRPPEFDGSGGRGHQASTFASMMFGGGIRGGRVVGVTDEWSKVPQDRPVSIPDFHATIYAAMGIQPDNHLITPAGRPVPITDYGTPLEELLA